MKSKASATKMRRTTISIRTGRRSSVLEGDALDHVRDVLAAVDRVLEDVEDLLPLDDVDRIGAVVEELRDGPPEKPVALVLEPVHLGAVADERLPVPHVAQAADGARDAVDRLDQHVGEIARVGLDLLDAVEPDALGGRLDQVEDVVHARDQAVDV